MRRGDGGALTAAQLMRLEYFTKQNACGLHDWPDWG